MKNRIIFIIGILLLIIVVLCVTMIGIDYNSKQKEQSFITTYTDYKYKNQEEFSLIIFRQNISKFN